MLSLPKANEASAAGQVRVCSHPKAWVGQGRRCRAEEWADGGKASKAEEWADGGKASKAEVWEVGDEASRAEVWADRDEISEAEVWADGVKVFRRHGVRGFRTQYQRWIRQKEILSDS